MEVLYGVDNVDTKLAEQNIFFATQAGPLLDALARGEYAVYLSSAHTDVIAQRKAGAPIKQIKPSDGVGITPINQALVLHAPHPNAGKLWIEWSLSEEGQTLLAQQGYAAVRKGLKCDGARSRHDRRQVPAARRRPGDVRAAGRPHQALERCVLQRCVRPFEVAGPSRTAGTRVPAVLAGYRLFQRRHTRHRAANLWQVLLLTNSTAQVGLVGLSDAVALLLLAPLGGAIADRMDRRTLLQITQSTSLVASLGLTIATFSNTIQPWEIYLAVIAVSAAQTFEGPARQALIPVMVSRERVVDAFALTNPTRELAILLGPPLAGILIATVGPGYVYAFDAVTYAMLAVFLGLIHIPKVSAVARRESIWSSIFEGFAYVRSRRLIWQLMSLDLSAQFFAAYQRRAADHRARYSGRGRGRLRRAGRPPRRLARSSAQRPSSGCAASRTRVG